MQVLTVLDDDLIAEGLSVTGLKNEQELIEQAVKELIKSCQANSKINPWQATINELAGAWDDFPNIEDLRARLMTQAPRESW